MKTEVKIQYWDDPEVNHLQDSYWTKAAMETAVGLFWFNHIQKANKPMCNLTLRIDRQRGVVVAYGFPDDE